MRVIAGEFRSRRLKSLPGPHLRPTPDRLRETLFDILDPRIEGVTFLDAYAGTGAVGIEALTLATDRRYAFQLVICQRAVMATQAIPIEHRLHFARKAESAGGAAPRRDFTG